MAITFQHFEGKGRGVVACRDFRAGELIERAPVIPIPADELSLLQQTRLGSYYFEWGNDCRQGAIALGHSSLYNHSYEPNARYETREAEDVIEIFALREIRAGEEITINYNNLHESAHQPLSFAVK
ncbi:MAG: SET domain-containing protein [Pirellulaceae bacterium]|nr:SET domain-containing protein [Pirellulaceae bacterium]